MVKPSENPSYIQVRQDLLGMIDRSRSCEAVLDVGCSRGATSAELRRIYGGSIKRIVGIELDKDAAQAAREDAGFDQVYCEDAEAALAKLVAQNETFDVVFCGDVLEHLKDPWQALQDIRALCSEQAQVIISLPNVGHYSTIVALLTQRWPYESRGIHDRTHLRWFASRNLKDLYAQASFKEVERRKTHRLIERPHKLNHKTERWVKRIPVVKTLTVFQFLSRLEPK